MPADFERIYALFQDKTPLAADCGSVCGAACCRDSGEDCGMRLFPGEREYLAAHWPKDCFRPTRDGGVLLVCDGRCDRRFRPLACRIFPLFPYRETSGRIRADYDPRALRLCPLVKLAGRTRLERSFVRTVRRAGRLLTADRECHRFLREQSGQLEEWKRLLPLVRVPIQRR